MRIAVVSVLGSAVLIALAATGATTTGAAATEVASLSSFRADRAVVIKSQRRLVLMRGDQVLKVYRVALGRYPKGHKIKSGDARTPEGLDYRLIRSITGSIGAPSTRRSTSHTPTGAMSRAPVSWACRRAARS